MLVESPNPLFLAWWRWYCPHALRRYFHRVMLYGDPVPPAAADPAAPGTLYLFDHLSWWDGVLAFHLLHSHFRERSPRCMVDEVQVRRHPFFRRIGAFSVDRSRPRDGIRAIRHAEALLERGHAVVMFPQGSIRPADAPIRLERGFTYLLDLCPTARVRVVSLRYDFWEHQRPELLVSIGPETPGSSAGLDDVTATLRCGGEELLRASVSRTPGELLLPPGR